MNKKFYWNSKNITAVLFLIILAALFAGSGFNVGKSILNSFMYYREADEPAGIISQDAVIRTDAKPTAAGAGGAAPVQAESSRVRTLFSLINSGITSIEVRYDENTLFRDKFVFLNSMVQLSFYKKIIEDSVESRTLYIMKNGQLTFGAEKPDNEENVKNIKELYEFICQKNMKMLYIQAPCKVNKFENLLPYGIDDRANAYADELLAGMKEYGIPVIDLRNEIHKAGLNYNTLFYNTDPHWRIETAFWAYGNVMKQLSANHDLQYNQQTTQLSSFKKIDLPQSFLGSEGIRVGRIVCGTDDFSYLIPNFETDYRVQTLNDDGSVNKNANGSFYETIIQKEILETSVRRFRYQAYFGADYPLIKITNHRQNKGSVLVIKDSFGLPFTGFLSLSFQETDMIDLRLFTKMSLNDFLEKNRYDYILFIYNPIALSTKELFDFR